MASIGPLRRGPSRAQKAAKRGGQRGLFQWALFAIVVIVGADDDVFDAIDINSREAAQLLVLFLPAFGRSRRERSEEHS